MLDRLCCGHSKNSFLASMKTCIPRGSTNMGMLWSTSAELVSTDNSSPISSCLCEKEM